MPDGRKVRGTKVQGREKILVLLYADDLVLICENGETLDMAMTRIEEYTQQWGLTVNVRKTKRMVNKETKIEQEVDIMIRGETVERVSEFVYLGSLIKDTGHSVEEVNRRLHLAQYRFHELKKPIFDQRNISIGTKVSIYKSTVLSTLLYGAETWTCSDRDYSRINAVNNKMLRYIIGKKRDEISNLELFKVTNTVPIENTVRNYRLRWAGHVRRMGDHRIPKKVLFGELDGTNKVGCPVKNWEKCLYEDLELIGLTKYSWLKASSIRSDWRKSISSLISLKRKK